MEKAINTRERLAVGINRAVLLSGDRDRDIALRIGTSQNNLYKWRQGYSMPNDKNLRKLAAVLDVDVQTLRDGYPFD